MRVDDRGDALTPRSLPEQGEAAAGTSAREARWRIAARAVAGVLVALGIAEVIWRHVPDHLQLRTDIIGYPVFYAFDYVRYFTAFSLLAILCPVLAFAVAHLLVGHGPLRRPSETRPLWPVRQELAPTPDEPDEPARWAPARLASLLARGVLPAGVLTAEVSAASATGPQHLAAPGWIAGGLYLVVLAAVAALCGWRARRARPGQARVDLARWFSVVNALMASVVVLGAWGVSRATNVTVAQPPRVVHYPWFPLWLALSVTLVVAALTARALRRGGVARWRQIEGAVLAGVVGVVAVYFLLAGFAGAQGAFDAFDPQELAGAQLVFVHGLLPWKDVLLLHGFIEDALDGWIGMALFSHSAWGAFTGIDLIVYPISGCVLYLSAVYFARGNRLVALLAGLLVVGGYTTAIMRFAYLPVLVVLFDKMLRSRRSVFAWAFMGLLVLQCALVPEMGLMAIAFLVVVVGRDLAVAPPGTRWWRRFNLTRRLVVSGLVGTALLCAYLVASGSLSAFVDFYRLFGSDHALWGAKPVSWSLTGQLRFSVYFVLPVVVMLAVIVRVVALVRTRRSLSSRDWTMLACALFVLVYFQKGLDRTDPSHVVEVFTVSTPLVMLAGIQSLEWLEGLAASALAWAHERFGALSRSPRPRLARRPVALAGALVLVGLVPNVFTKLNQMPGALHATAPVPAQVARLGYEVPGAFNYPELSALSALIDRYAGPTGPVFDFANEPDITYFLLNRVPGSSFFHVESAQTYAAQMLVIHQLEASRPRVVIFTSQDYGLGLAYDGIPGMVRQWKISQYLLQHYRPLADAYGQLLMVRDDLVNKIPSVASAHLAGVSTTGLYFAGQSCLWGDTPNFFVPTGLSRAPGVTAGVSAGGVVNAQVQGWAVDATKKVPAREVFAVSDHKVIGTARPDLYRLDIERYFKTPAVLYSGWSMDVELPRGQKMQLYSLNRNGTVSRLQPNPAPKWLASSPRLHSVIAPGGVRRKIFRGKWLPGWTNYLTPLHATVYHLVVPASARLSRYQWLTLRSTKSLGGARYVLGDLPAETGHQISFTTLRGPRRSVSVRVGSCLDWYGFPHRLDLLVYRSRRVAPAPIVARLAEAPKGE